MEACHFSVEKTKDSFLENLALQKYLREFAPSNKLTLTRKGLPKFLRLNSEGSFQLLVGKGSLESLTQGMQNVGMQLESVHFADAVKILDLPTQLKCLREINLKTASNFYGYSFNHDALAFLEHLEVLTVRVNPFYEVFRALEVSHPSFELLRSLSLSGFSLSSINFKGSDWRSLLGKFKKLKHLSLEEFNEFSEELQYILPHDIVLKSLESFRFYCEGGKVFYLMLPEDFFLQRMPNLKRLTWSFELFSGERFPALPASITHLEVLSLPFNRMTLDPSLTNLRFVKLSYVKDVNLSNLRNSFITSLTIICSNVIESIPELPWLRRLDLLGVNLYHEILIIPSHFPKLVSLLLNRASVILVDQLHLLRHLQELKIIGGKYHLDVGSALSCEYFPKLKHLHLEEFPNLTCSAVKEPFHSLESLHLDSTDFPTINQDFFDCFLKILPQRGKFKKLCIKGSDVHDISPLGSIDSLESLILETRTSRVLKGVQTLTNIRKLHLTLVAPLPVDHLPSAMMNVESLELLLLSTDNDALSEIVTRAPKLQFVRCHVIPMVDYMLKIPFAIERNLEIVNPIVVRAENSDRDPRLYSMLMKIIESKNS